MLIDYAATDGRKLKGAVILPPGYRERRRYPTITWVYGGYVVRGSDDLFLDPYMPGLYNLQLYAARGYVVLIPSMPLKRDAPANDSMTIWARACCPQSTGWSRWASPIPRASG